MICQICGKPGHHGNACRKKCKLCNQPGHKEKNCKLSQTAVHHAVGPTSILGQSQKPIVYVMQPDGQLQRMQEVPTAHNDTAAKWEEVNVPFKCSELEIKLLCLNEECEAIKQAFNKQVINFKVSCTGVKFFIISPVTEEIRNRQTA